MEERTMTRENLQQLLRGAEHAHAEYERTLGHADADWAAWYARWIFEQLPREESPTSAQ